MNRRIGSVALCGLLLAACSVAEAPPPHTTASPTATTAPSPTPFSAPSNAPTPMPIASSAVTPEPQPTAEATPLPGTTPFPTPGPTITPGSTRVIGQVRLANGAPAQGVCVVLEKGNCPIATDDQGRWFTDIPAGPIRWNFIYKVGGQEAGRQFVLETAGGELRLPIYILTG